MSLSGEERAQALRLSEKLVDDFDQERAARFSYEHQDKEWHEDFSTLFNMMTAPDFCLSAGAWASIAGALAYVVFPVDIIPDFIPLIGWLDDIFVLGWVMKVLADEIADYQNFCQHRVTPIMVDAYVVRDRKSSISSIAALG
jgi:uncharacterized membrane protein YkvA (DUF1232 family)